MKRNLAYLLLTLVVVSCGAPNGRFRLKGRLQNFNQGEFYLYSLDGRGRLDTIPVREGRFQYEAEAEEPTPYALVFPNFSEVPIFAESGATVDVEGDASHLKEVIVAGTKENDLMTAFRLKVAEMTPPQVLKEAEAFIHENATSMSSLYLLNKHFVQNTDADYQKAAKLAGIIAKAQPENLRAVTLQKKLKGLKNLKEGQQLPTFRGTDIRGQQVSNDQLKSDINVLTVWATWNYESTNLMRQLRLLKRDYKSRLGIVSISVDGNKYDCKTTIERDSVNWSVVCDGRMFDTPTLQQLGISDVPYNILLDKTGKILAVNLNQTELKLRIKKALKAEN